MGNWIPCVVSTYGIDDFPAARQPRSPLSVNQLFGAFGGADDGFDQRDAEATLFEFKNAVDGATGGGGDNVFQFCGMFACFEHHP